MMPSSYTPPNISVIMNCFNGEKYLREAIDSIYAQTYSNWEIIFWDNASSDNSSRIANSYDKKLKYYRSDKNTRLGEARVYALEKALGDYVAFLDVDDIFLPSMLEEQLNTFNNSTEELGFVYGRVEFFSENKSSKYNYVFKEAKSLKSGEIFSDLCKEDFIPWPSVLVSRKRLLECGGFPSDFYLSADYWIFVNMSRNFQVGVNQNVVSKVRIHENNLSHTQHVLAAKENIKIVERYLSHDGVKNSLKYQYASLTFAYIKEKKYLKAILLLIKKNILKIIFFRIIHKIFRVFIRITNNLNLYKN
jgi:glycosyltransferase involved in cell wall biosynthesis